MKRRKAPQTTMESVARAIGSTIGVAVRTAGTVVDDLAKAAKKATGKLPEKKSRKKTATRAKKPTSVGANSGKRTARKVVSSAKAPKRPKKAK